jgi:hypothetical protein
MFAIIKFIELLFHIGSDEFGGWCYGWLIIKFFEFVMRVGCLPFRDWFYFFLFHQLWHLP